VILVAAVVPMRHGGMVVSRVATWLRDDDTAIGVLADLPQKLCKPLAFALADWPRKLNGLTDSLQFLASHF
jgi:hypothetical protein